MYHQSEKSLHNITIHYSLLLSLFLWINSLIPCEKDTHGEEKVTENDFIGRNFIKWNIFLC